MIDEMDMIYDTSAPSRVSEREVIGMIDEIDTIYVTGAANRTSVREKS